MTMDSGSSEQEQAMPADSDAAAQDGVDSRADETTTERLNGLMRLVGKRTTEAEQQKARADQAEAALAAATSRLAAYEDGSAHMGDDEAMAVQNSEEQSPDQYPPEADDPDAFNYWVPDSMQGNAWSDPSSLIDPNAASRASSLRATNPTETEYVRNQFERDLDAALTSWGVEARD